MMLIISSRRILALSLLFVTVTSSFDSSEGIKLNRTFGMTPAAQVIADARKEAAGLGVGGHTAYLHSRGEPRGRVATERVATRKQDLQHMPSRNRARNKAPQPEQKQAQAQQQPIDFSNLTRGALFGNTNNRTPDIFIKNLEGVVTDTSGSDTSGSVPPSTASSRPSSAEERVAGRKARRSKEESLLPLDPSNLLQAALFDNTNAILSKAKDVLSGNASYGTTSSGPRRVSNQSGVGLLTQARRSTTPAAPTKPALLVQSQSEVAI